VTNASSTPAQHALITGATGFIGQGLCQQLYNRGDYIRAAIRQVTAGPWQDAVQLDLETQPLPTHALDRIDTIFHLAGRAHALAETAQDKELYFRINTEGTRALLEAASRANVHRFVFFSSVKAMGEESTDQDETAFCHPETPYGESKLAAERLVLAGGYVPEPVVLRLSMVYGCSPKGNLPRMIEAIAKGRFPPLPELGNQRSMVHVDDVIQAAILASESPAAAGQTYIITDGQPISTRGLFELICEELGKPVPGWSIPVSALRGLALTGDLIGRARGRRFMFDSDALAKLTESACYSSEKIQRDLGFRPCRDLRASLPEIAAYLGVK